MILDEYYFADPRLVLVPIEHLDSGGVSTAFATALRERCQWTAERVALLSHGFALYWTRSTELARRDPSWPPPRLRHIAVVDDPRAVHPHAQLLNASAWTLYACDLDPAVSHVELVAYLLAHGERATLLGEVSRPALYNAAWWFERSDAECAAFAAAAEASARPDAAALRAIAAALPWLRRLSQTEIRPAVSERLVERCADAARDAARMYTASWRATDLAAVAALAHWLATTAPPILIACRGGRVVWHPNTPARVGALRDELKRASGAAVRDIHADLAVVDRHTRRFLASLADPAALPAASRADEQRGYTYLHRQQRLLVYDLDEPGIDRRHGPALPYARAMLGARAVHEWAHLAVDAGAVPLAVPAATLAARVEALAERLEAVATAAPARVRQATADDLNALAASEAAAPGTALARVLVRRMPDFQANLLAMRYLGEAERETYVRQNARTLRGEFSLPRLWRLLIRYLYEFQYLRFSAVADRRTFFLRSTWFDADFFDRGVLDGAAFDALTTAVAAICDCYAVDERRFVDIPA